jgi:DNA-binding XRE family transcriptional regulator
VGDIQIIKTEAGEELVVLSRRDYDMLLARLGDEDAEDRASVRLVEESRSRLARGEDLVLPEETWERIEAGMHPIEALRRHRGLTQVALAGAAGITQGYLSEIENRKKVGDLAVLKRIAAALDAPLDVVTDDSHAPPPPAAASSPGSA